ncbi:MAG: hypothetical protein E6I75_08850 [Chloroflexi bacterium]|nr:MAG: hypothetical protein E6I75_08850 [Chloroflexota bacterium]
MPASTSDQRPVAVVHGLDAPAVARVGERIDINLDLQASQPVDGRLRLSVDQAVIANGSVHLDPGDTRVSLSTPVAAPGFVVLRAELVVGGISSALSSVVVAKPAGRVLVLEDEAKQADPLVSLLTDQGLEVERRAAASVPPSANDLSAYDGIVLVNTPATSLSLDQQRTLQSFVQDLGRARFRRAATRARSSTT